MARGGRYRVPLKRRRLCLTNYYKRRKLVLSGKPRLVVRKTLKYIIVQVVGVKPEGDVVYASAHSNELRKFGWKASTKNTPAAYLTGYLAALRALKAGVKEAILDIGLYRAVKGAKVFAAALGAIHAGLKVPMGESILPDEGRIRGEHVANYARLLKETNEEEFRRRFSCYLERGLDPEKLPEHFEEVKAAIDERFKSSA